MKLKDVLRQARGFVTKSQGYQCPYCPYVSKDRGNGKTADYWHHLATVHDDVDTGLIHD